MNEWDEAKRLSNLDKHGLDFVDADQLFDGRKIVSTAAHSSLEPRVRTTGVIDGVMQTLVWTWRGESRRFISFRRARDEEKREHRQLYG